MRKYSGTAYVATRTLIAAIVVSIGMTFTLAPSSGARLLKATAAMRHTSRHTSGRGIVTMAETAAGGAPNFIMPFMNAGENSPANDILSAQLWPTLYQLGVPGNANKINTALSLADPPVWSHGGTQVSITLKPYRWSDGTPVTVRDIVFFLNILKAEKKTWIHWQPGGMPTDILSWTVHGTRTLILKLDKVTNTVWYTDTDLSHIVPMPQQAWDKTSSTGTIGNYDETPSGAAAVYKYLQQQGENLAAYNTNPLWRVVDGPWLLKQYTADFVALVPNPAYSGPDKPHISKFEEVPFTSSASEFNALLAGNLDVGYLPLTDSSEIARVKSAGFNIVRSENIAGSFFGLNYHNPQIGPLVKELYIREALNAVMNERGQIKSILRGNGFPVYGPFPSVPSSPYLASISKKSPFSISHARKLLTEHGWHIPPNGPATCVRPGLTRADCGKAITKGEKLRFKLLYESGTGYLSAVMDNYKSDASEAGITIALSSAPFSTITGAICGNPTCTSPGPQLENWGGGYAMNFGSPFPELGATMLTGHVGLDFPVTKTGRRLIQATETATGASVVQAMRKYDAWAVKNDPEVWQVETYDLYAVSKKLKGVFIDPVEGYIAPQNWSVKRSG